MKATWPMDTDLPDVLVAGLTGRHLLLAAPGVTGVVVGTWLLVAHAVPCGPASSGWRCSAGSRC
jgi:hypothetical protein